MIKAICNAILGGLIFMSVIAICAVALSPDDTARDTHMVRVLSD